MSITAPETIQPAVPEPAAADPPALFRYSTWVHVGAGADQCSEVDEAEGRNGCGDRGHFHAWCRLPNSLQQAEIRERAMAAKARKIRQLHDPESNAFVILEEELDALAREGDRAREKLVEELLAKDFWQDYYQALQDVRQIDADHATDGEEPPKLYARIEHDQARLLRLEATPEAERPGDEYDELQRHCKAYQEAIDRAVKDRQDPKRDALDGLETGQLIDELRSKRIETEALREFQRVFQVNEWLSCAYREPDGTPALADMAVLERAASEVVRALQATFEDLTRTAQEAQGN